MRRIALGLAAAVALLLSSTTGVAAALPSIKHVWIVVLENENYDTTFGPNSKAPYLAKTLASQGQLLTQYYGIGHFSLDNYIAMVSGQPPNPQTQADCMFYSEFAGTVGPDGIAVGQGCVYPTAVKTVGDQLEGKGLTWKEYAEDLGTACRHPALNSQDTTQTAHKNDQYAARHNPFVYFHSIIDRPICNTSVLDLSKLQGDLGSAATTPSYSYLTPDLCSDGHDAPCVDGRPGGLVSVNRWMRRWVPLILGSPAFQRDGVLIITSDESDGPDSDSSACCHEQPGPNSPMPGINGMGGGRIGALVISRWTQPNSWSTTPYNHYSLLASLEEIFGRKHLGFAAQAGLNRFGLDVYNAYRP